MAANSSWRFELEPMAGIEPATDGLRNRCSTTELHWLAAKPHWAGIRRGPPKRPYSYNRNGPTGQELDAGRRLAVSRTAHLVPGKRFGLSESAVWLAYRVLLIKRPLNQLGNNWQTRRPAKRRLNLYAKVFGTVPGPVALRRQVQQPHLVVSLNLQSRNKN